MLIFTNKLLPGLILASLMSISLPTAALSAEVGQEALTRELATLFRAARAVISDNQTAINDPALGDKGLSGANVIKLAKANFQKTTGKALVVGETATVRGMAVDKLLKVITKVMDQNQTLINEKGKGFKGFLPAVFGRQVAQDFTASMNGKIFIKLTAPANYVRNRANRPDEWETDVIEKKFREASWTKNKEFSESAPYKGKPAFRLLIPEYYQESCLKCHGDPKGEKDITGGLKEGGKLEELGGAISITIVN